MLHYIHTWHRKFQINTSKCLFKIILPNIMSHHGVSPYGKLTIGIIQRIHMNMIVKKSLLYQMHFNFLNENLIFPNLRKLSPPPHIPTVFQNNSESWLSLYYFYCLLWTVRWCELQPIKNYSLSLIVKCPDGNSALINI